MTDKDSINRIPFNQPYMSGKELYYIAQAHLGGMLAGDGPFTKKCHSWLEQYTGTPKALLTHSCTAALEMSAILLDIKPGDEVIMPSYTFVSTANAFVLRGAVPVFVDIREDTLNIDERLIEKHITPKTRAIVPVHYAGVGCEMESILDLAKKYKLAVVEDAAQGMMAKWRGKALGTIGNLGCVSFHETKNLISGEGGALFVGDKKYFDRAEIIREKGTDRSKFLRGEIDKYSWHDIGSSFLPGELIAAFLWAQLEQAQKITAERKKLWQIYHDLFEPLETAGVLRRPYVPPDCEHNAHLYFIVLNNTALTENVLTNLRDHDIGAHRHYVPLHSSPAAQKYCRSSANMDVTDYVSHALIRLPLWLGLLPEQQNRVEEQIKKSTH